MSFGVESVEMMKFMSDETNGGILANKIESISVAAFAEKVDTLRENAVILDLGQAQTYARGHIPGAVHLPITKIVREEGYATGLLPSQSALCALSEEYGLNSNKTVYLYDDEGGGWAGRMAWILDILCVPHIVYIDGGLRAWMRAGYALESERMASCAGPAPTVLNLEPNVELNEMLQLVESKLVHILDARSAGEYQAVRQYAKRPGRIPRAVHMEWTDCMSVSTDYTLKPLDDLRAMLVSQGISDSKPVVTYCQTHHRSGLNYLVCRLLGLNVRAYAGSWSEWGNHPETPIESDIV